MDESEKRLKQEDCNEDTLGAGILTLTNKRIAFDKTRGRIADFTKRVDETILDVPLNEITKVWKEGLFIKKACIRAKTKDGEQDYKFGVFSTGSWQKDIQKAINDYKPQ
ncbi:hypothetical protein [Candidatus Nitrosotenuis cloacae]|jgi:hypothetical protein|uniref:GRAM domain-containing protein n=1 Tax=Candidatus Nitrosotenuis cloacae TaxID=1603555 RepID=A0A3G1B494_9ARCH|nr:hypothetical protein [Candidatus Nitrosotenuis cloacae]AJZ75743.1 hypothetical protein SU86_004470 [Candidatus Nitrosotenuis cloacae]MDG7050051.1 hypothetical protein [Nitrososphaerota archaeon]